MGNTSPGCAAAGVEVGAIIERGVGTVRLAAVGWPTKVVNAMGHLSVCICVGLQFSHISVGAASGWLIEIAITFPAAAAAAAAAVWCFVIIVRPFLKNRAP